MSKLVDIDTILDLIADVHEIDNLTHVGQFNGLEVVELKCGADVHSSFLLTSTDLTTLLPLLANQLTIVRETP